jgi:hypothetical protein
MVNGIEARCTGRDAFSSQRIGFKMSLALMRRFAPLSLLAVPLLIPVAVTAGEASTVTPRTIPAAAAGVAFGTSLGGDTNKTVQMFPNARILRVFENTLSSNLPALPAGAQVWVSFNTSPAMVASGQYNAQFATILQSWNSSGRTVYWDWQHEADNPRDHLSPTTIRAGWAQLLSVEKKYPSAHVKSMSIYEGYLLDASKPHGDPALWYVNADVLGFDCYVPSNVVRAMQYAKSKGKPWAIPEFGYNRGDSADVAYLTSTIQSWAAYPPIGASWYNNGPTFSQPLTQIPKTLAYLRALAG